MPRYSIGHATAPKARVAGQGFTVVAPIAGGLLPHVRHLISVCRTDPQYTAQATYRTSIVSTVFRRSCIHAIHPSPGSTVTQHDLLTRLFLLTLKRQDPYCPNNLVKLSRLKREPPVRASQ